MALALARSLLQEGRCDAAAAAAACGAAFDPKRAYRQFDRNVYQALQDGDDYRETSARCGRLGQARACCLPAWAACLQPMRSLLGAAPLLPALA